MPYSDRVAFYEALGFQKAEDATPMFITTGGEK
jgi:hypothetical protein